LGGAAQITPRAAAALASFDWPGNVRQLAHTLQRIVALRVRRIDIEHLPREMRALRSVPDEREAVERALEATGGNISHAAERLGITRHGLKKRMLRLGMRSKS
jgi:DNA-binding NtrC family response regulator